MPTAVFRRPPRTPCCGNVASLGTVLICPAQPHPDVPLQCLRVASFIRSNARPMSTDAVQSEIGRRASMTVFWSSRGAIHQRHAGIIPATDLECSLHIC